ncbi:hypothetical protein MMC29_001898 [Sticta canariensis]|nr:hypothetical protein [Sticta canariensis]
MAVSRSFLLLVGGLYAIQALCSTDCSYPSNECISKVNNIAYCCNPLETCNTNGNSLSTQCVNQSAKCPYTTCTYPGGKTNCCAKGTQCIQRGEYKGVCAKFPNQNTCSAPNRICVTNPFTQTAQCCKPSEKCTPIGCKKSCPANPPANGYGDCSKAPGTTPCQKPDGSHNCCDKDHTCITNGPYKGQCGTGFFDYNKFCLDSQNKDGSKGYVCVNDATSLSATCCKNNELCTSDGCYDPPIPNCDAPGFSQCFTKDSVGTCCTPYQNCITVGPSQGKCVAKPADNGQGPCTGPDRDPCGKTCCRTDKTTGAPLYCAQADIGLCCHSGERVVNGKCCKSGQVNGRGECCVLPQIPWNDICLPGRADCPVGKNGGGMIRIF